jgi:transposase-like protein
VSEVRRRFDPDFRAGAVRIVKESGKPIAQVARELGINGVVLESPSEHQVYSFRGKDSHPTE